MASRQCWNSRALSALIELEGMPLVGNLRFKMLAGRRLARMSRPYSDDLRGRVISAVESGMSRRQAAGVLSVGVSSVIRWVQQHQSPVTSQLGGCRSEPTNERM